MSEYQFIQVNDKKQQKMFLDLPGRIYALGENPQDYKTEKQIIEWTHPLSTNMKVYPFVVIDESKCAVCRCILTYYPNDPVAYVGFFEAFNDRESVKFMFDNIEYKAFKDGKTTLLGPIDSSIYIRYRFKINDFDETYTGEPYNKYYYSELWEYAGFVVSDRYVSNKIRVPKDSDCDEKLKKIYNRFINRGYKFVDAKEEDFYQYLDEMYSLIMKLYSGFSGYKPINEEQFIRLFGPLKNIINFDMVKFVYNKNDKLCAFCISLPNYGKLTQGKITLSKILKIKKIKKNPKEYVILYVGADTDSIGLGGALMQYVYNELIKNECSSIGALIKEGNVTGKMYNKLYTGQFQYVLLKKEIKDNIYIEI